MGRPRLGRAAGSVQASEFATVPDQCKQVTAEAIAARFEHRQRHGGGECGIEGIATTMEHRNASLRRQRLRCRDDVPGKNRRAA